MLFRADASEEIGTGHLMRCLALAGEMGRRGAACAFLMHHRTPEHLTQRVAQQSHELLLLHPNRLRPSAQEEPSAPHSHWLPSGWQADASACLKALAGRPAADWLVVDHYALDDRWEQALRPAGRRILAIDDLADRKHDCDVLLDQNYVAGMETRYSGLVPSGCERLLGPRYALLRPEFAHRRADAKSRDGTIRRVLVCFGGAGTEARTLAAVKGLRPYASSLERIDVVAGPATASASKIGTLAVRIPNLVIHSPAKDMAELLGAADLAIGGAGTMNWERACLGVPTLAYAIARNQRDSLASLIEAGYVLGCATSAEPDASNLAAWLSCLMNNPELLRGLSQRSATLTDGQGARRVADALAPEPIVFRRATSADSDNLLRWRNDPAVRAVSLNTAEIDRATHEAWLAKTLADPNRVLLLAERKGEAVGTVRFDLSPPDCVISVYRVPAAKRGIGLIKQATGWLRAHHPEIRTIKAEVLPGNAQSVAAFRRSGYHEAKQVLVMELYP